MKQSNHIGCKGKREFENKHDAYLHIYSKIEESYGGMTFLRSYKCKYCKKYHLTSREIR